MELKGEQFIRAPREQVWAALNNPDVLAQCIPGCEQLVRIGDNQFDGKVTAKVGPVKATFAGGVTLTNINPPSSYTITGEGKGGVAGFAKGGADIALTEQDDGTVLRYAVKAAVGGKLAQIGARLIDGVAREYAEAFFAKFCAILEADASPAPAVAEPTQAVAPPPESVSSPTKPFGNKWLVLGVATVVAILAAVAIFGG